MMAIKRIICPIALFLVWLGGTALADDISFEVTVDRNKVSLGSSVQLSLNFKGTQEVPQPNLPDIEGFEWKYVGPSTNFSIVNQKVSSSITHIYMLIPVRTGILTIPSFTFNYKGKNYSSDPIKIEVVEGPLMQPRSGPPQSAGGSGKAEALEDKVFLVMEAGKKKAYINEGIPLKIKLYVSGLTMRDIQLPQFVHGGFSVDEFGQAKRYREVLGGVPYEVVEFNTNVYGMRPGAFTLGPARLQCNLVVRRNPRRRPFFNEGFFNDDFFDNFFGRYETRPLELESTGTPVTVMKLPQDNIPPGFTGAIGNFRFYIQADPKEVKVGDPITLKMVVAGKGNFKTVNNPTLDFGDDFKAYDPEVKQGEGSKTFEQVIIPKRDDIKEIPGIAFSFFDTETGGYKTIRKGPIPIKVNPVARGEKLKIFEAPEASRELFRKREEVLGRDIIYIKESPGTFRKRGEFLYKNRLFLMAQCIPVIVVVSFVVFYKKKERLQRDIRYARRLRAPRKAKKNLANTHRLLGSKDPNIFFDAVFKTLQEYLGDKFHLPTAGITSSVIEDLRERGIKREVLTMLERCFNNCDMARYAPSSVTGEDMAGAYKLLEEVIDELERSKV